MVEIFNEDALKAFVDARIEAASQVPDPPPDPGDPPDPVEYPWFNGNASETTWLGRQWLTRKPSKLHADGSMEKRNTTRTLMTPELEGTASQGIRSGRVKWSCRVDEAFIRPKPSAGGQHFAQVATLGSCGGQTPSLVRPNIRIEIVQLTPPVMFVWNYGPDWGGRTIGQKQCYPDVLPADAWHDMEISWFIGTRYMDATVNIDGYNTRIEDMSIEPGTIGPLYFGPGHWETPHTSGRSHWRDIRVG